MNLQEAPTAVVRLRAMLLARNHLLKRGEKRVRDKGMEKRVRELSNETSEKKIKTDKTKFDSARIWFAP